MIKQFLAMLLLTGLLSAESTANKTTHLCAVGSTPSFRSYEVCVDLFPGLSKEVDIVIVKDFIVDTLSEENDAKMSEFRDQLSQKTKIWMENKLNVYITKIKRVDPSKI